MSHHYLYTTIRPGQLLQVDDAEYADLAAQNLILAEVDPADIREPISDSVVAPPVDGAETLADDQPADPASSSGG